MAFIDDASNSKDIESLTQILDATKLSQRENAWEEFFLRVEADSGDETVNFSGDQEPRAQELVELSDYEKHVVNVIENKLGSNVKELLYKREKYKLLEDAEKFELVSQKWREALKHLVKNKLTDDDIEFYIRFLLKPDEKVCDFVENELYCQFKESYINLCEAVAQNDKKESVWKTRTQMEWKYLIKHLPEKDAIVYAYNVAVNYNNS